MLKKVNRLRLVINKQCSGIAARYYSNRFRVTGNKVDKLANRYFRLKQQKAQSASEIDDLHQSIDDTMSRLGLSKNNDRRTNFCLVGGRKCQH